MADDENNGVRSYVAAGCDYFFFCDLCVQYGENIEAFGYCIDCQDYLCRDCFNTHLRPKPSRLHVLLDQRQMPKDQQQMQKDQQLNTDRDACTEVCTSHPRKTLEYYCSEHDTLGCSVCMTLNHRACKQVYHIPDIASDILSSTDYVNIQEKIMALTKRTNTTIQKSRDQMKCSKTYHTDALDSLKRVIQDIRIAADKIENTVVGEAMRMETKDAQRMKEVEVTCNTTLDSIDRITSRFTGLQNNGQLCQLFIAMKRATQEIDAIEARVSEPEQTIEAVNYRLVISTDIQTIIDSPESMVTLKLCHETQSRTAITQDASSDTHVHNETNEDVLLPKLPKTLEVKQRITTRCSKRLKAFIISAAVLLLAWLFYQITAPAQTSAPVKYNRGDWESRSEHVMDLHVDIINDIERQEMRNWIQLPDRKLVIVDYKNDKVKLINDDGTLVSQLELRGGAGDITKVSSTQVAVTSPNKQTIYIVSVNDMLMLESEIKVEGRCQGLASLDDEKFVVSYDEPVKVEIISTLGHVLQTVVTEEKGRELFTWPWSVAVTNDKHTIYITDWYSDTITSLDLAGQVQATYKTNHTVNSVARMHLTNYNKLK